ncbi:MAG: lysozyme inhibitor LprI family protein [Burkholderiaceae bacterium]
MKTVMVLAASLLAGAAHAGALDECYQKTSNRSEVGSCLEAARTEAFAQERLAARALEANLAELQAISSAKGLVMALRSAERHFEPYMKAQCELVRATYASGTGAAQAALACEVDLLRARATELKPMTPAAPAAN